MCVYMYLYIYIYIFIYIIIRNTGKDFRGDLYPLRSSVIIAPGGCGDDQGVYMITEVITVVFPYFIY